MRLRVTSTKNFALATLLAKKIGQIGGFLAPKFSGKSITGEISF